MSGYTICQTNAPLCNNAEDLFLNGQRLTPVSSASSVASGTFFFDYGNSTITIGDNPAGQTVETSVATAAFTHASDNTFRNLTIEEFGNEAQSGAIAGSNLTIDHDVVQLNHGQGISQYSGSITNTRILRNGQLGIGGGGLNLLVDTDEIGWNNTAGYDPAWEAGGTKWAYSTGLVVQRVWSHDNDGAGLTTDVDNVDTTYENNVVENNAFMGIMHEISGAAKIRGNIVRNNGTADSWWTSRTGIEVADSHDVSVTDNLIVDNGGGGILGTQDARAEDEGPGTWQLKNLDVENNVIRTNAVPTVYKPIGGGISVTPDTANRGQYFTPAFHNVFRNNAYSVPAAAAQAGYFLVLASPSTMDTFPQWQASGQDQGSIFAS